MAAILSCGAGAVVSHRSAAALWKIWRSDASLVDVSVPPRRDCRPPGIVVHRRSGLTREDFEMRDRIPTTSVACTLVDIATLINPYQLEAAINEADTLDLLTPEALRSAIDRFRGRPGVRALRQVLDRRTFVRTDSELERRFVPLARNAGLPRPLTGSYVKGFKVDFHWPDLSLVVETDGLRYHRTPAQQAKDRLRDQTLAAAGITTLRFTHAQVWSEPDYVRNILATVARQCRRRYT